MPLVVVQYKAGLIAEEVVARLAKLLPLVVGRALDAPESQDSRLTPGEVEVWVQESGRLDVNTKHLEILIWANSYPERLRNLGERRDAILQGVRSFLRAFPNGYVLNFSVSVLVQLQPGAYGEFTL